MKNVKGTMWITDVRSMLRQLTIRISKRCDLDFRVNKDMVEHIMSEELAIAERSIDEGVSYQYIIGDYKPILSKQEKEDAVVTLYGCTLED